MSKVIEKKIDKFIMRVKAKEGGIHATLRKWKEGSKREREPELLYVLRQEIKPGMVLMDLGANIGYVTLIMGDMLKGKGMIYAIEPDPSNIDILRYNIEVNDYSKFVDIHHIAISDKIGESDFYMARASNLSSMTKTKSTRKIVKIRTDTIDNFFKNRGKKIDLIKMDIEGHEVSVLNGGYGFFRDNKDLGCKIIMEIHPQFYGENNNLEDALKKYLKIGFNTKYVISAAVPVPDLFKKMGHDNPIKTFKSSGYIRGLYDNFKNKSMLKVACYKHKQRVEDRNKISNKIVRYVMIER